ncbi:carbon storage regulator [Vibrio fluvialis]|uniref:carbon storage regulator n=1 Tax=Vibrio fluvialis TaxID=676 RepID=UPI001EEB38E5|nr:carbon storage regulator [Vibrio fluvialis]ELL9330601.1 carbon storage regulator [Vibrio fluvialis]MCG6348502.1 carbon storage regulator [Vibrio fluvialis]MDZ5516699.1 carbon storage regulator [Vibrio fluvialis]
MRLALFALSAMATLSANADDISLTELELSGAEMDSSRGGQYYIDIENITASSELNGLSTGNMVSNSLTGNNILSDGALANSSGINNVIQNSGNNVLIQNSTVVNLTLK